MNHRKNLFFLLLLAVLSLFAYAGIGHLFTSGKLSSSLINCVVQDRYGYIWVGTEYGLNKFDGYHFTTYLHDDNDSTSVIDNTITSFLVDSRGRLWIGSAKGLMRYDYENNCFVHYPVPSGRRMRIYSIIESRSGDILVGSAGFGLYSIGKNAEKMVYEKQYSRRDSDNFFTHIYEDRRGDLWQSSHINDFTYYRHKNGRVIPIDFTSPVGAPVAFRQTDSLHLLIVCMGGVLLYDYSTGKVSDAGYDLGAYRGRVTINTAAMDHSGNLYVGTSDCGVLVARHGSKTFVPYEQPASERFDLSASYVKDIMEDKDHNLWVGCYRKGLYLINDERVAFTSWTFADQNYSIGSCVSSLAMGDDGTTLCAVQNSGVFRFDASGNIISHPNSPTGTSLIYRDRQGHYWAGTGNGLYSYDPVTGAYEKKISYAADGTYCITDNGQGMLYISVYSKGLYTYNVQTGAVRKYSMSDNGVGGHLCNDWIRSMIIDHKGLLWIGTSNGVSCMDTRTGSFHPFKWDYLLYNLQTNYLCEDNSGNIIIGTDNGLYLYDRKADKTKLFPHSETLKGKQICGIVVDDDGDVWTSTTHGIWQYDHKNERFIGHISGNGLVTSEYSQGSALRYPDGRIAFGTGEGITTFSPDTVRNSRPSKGDVHLTNFLIDGKPINCMRDEFAVPYSENTFTLEFSLLNYKNTDNVTFAYRINGGDWAFTNEGVNSIPFIKLEPGKYVIDVCAYDNGMPSGKTKTITVNVGHPWYSSPLAIVLYIIILGAVGYFFFRGYSRRKKAELEESKMRFLIDATHDIKSPLTLIVGPLKKLKEHIPSDDESQSYIQTIERNAHRLLILVNQILDQRKIDKNQMHLHCRETEMVAFVKNICNLYRPAAEDRNIKFNFVPSVSEVHAWIDVTNFDKVVSNLLSNAIKYTFNNGTIDVVVDSDGTSFRMDVLDTGIGIKKMDTERIFERFYRGSGTPGVHIEGTGIGLNLCRNIVRMHGGSINAENRRDVAHGADFSVIIPLGNSHLKPEEIVTDEEEQAPSLVKKSAPSKNCRVLVVDDDREIALYINNELSQWYRFDYSPNGRDALKKLLTDSYDLVISDVKMPVMDGITLLKKIKSNSNISDIPVILLTSKASVEDRLDGLKKGADAFLAKPFSMDELHVLIDNLIDNVRRLRGKFSGAQEQKDKIADVEVKGNDDALMERIMQEINAHLSEPEFNVESLTKDVGISRAQLHRKMKEITGISAGEFIRNLRLEQAARLIAKGEINITQVAFAVGFNNQTHFSTVFKKHYGMTPTEYSEHSKKQSENK